MPQVSKFLLTPEVWDRIFNLFVDSIVKIKDKKKLDGFIDNFFTPTEKIMFAKRLAAAVMIAKGTDYRTIITTLRISPPTIARMSFRINYEGEGLVLVIEDILKREAAKIFWEEIMDLVDMPGKGKNWSEVGRRKYLRRQKISRLKTAI